MNWLLIVIADTADLADCGGGSQGMVKRNHFFLSP